MTDKKDIMFIDHILDSIKAIEDFSKNISKEELASNRMKQSAIVREIEIIGEAVKNMSPSLKNKYSNIPWKEIIGTRDKMIHHYFGVDLEIVWNIIKENLPILKKELVSIRNSL